MFKSFFPKPGTFFLSAFVWALIAVIFWQAGGGGLGGAYHRSFRADPD